MILSKPGQKLNPIIAQWTAPIYKRDPVRYQRLCLWVWKQQNEGWPDEAIAECLKMADPAIDAVGNWWPYITKLMPKAKGRAAETESDEHKRGDMEIAVEFVEFLKKRGAR